MNYTSSEVIQILIGAYIIFRIAYSKLSFINRLLVIGLVVVAIRTFVLD